MYALRERHSACPGMNLGARLCALRRRSPPDCARHNPRREAFGNVVRVRSTGAVRLDDGGTAGFRQGARRPSLPRRPSSPPTGSALLPGLEGCTLRCGRPVVGGMSGRTAPRCGGSTMVRYLIALSLAALTMFAPAVAAEFGTKEEAIAMVKRVQEEFKRMVPRPLSRPCRTSRQKNFMIAICIPSSTT